MIYFVRHGLSEANVRRVFAGQKDNSPLVDEGRKQAKDTAKKIKDEGIEIHKIVSSPSLRAHETAQIIAKELGFNTSDIIIDHCINEYDMGSLSGTPWHTISSAILVNAEEAEEIIGVSHYFLSLVSPLFLKFVPKVPMIRHNTIR